jgi:hypothetical protein
MIFYSFSLTSIHFSGPFSTRNEEPEIKFAAETLSIKCTHISEIAMRQQIQSTASKLEVSTGIG